MGKYSRLGKNTLLVFIGNAGARFIGLVMLPFYTNWLSVEDYGTTDMIHVYITILVSLITCCLSEAVFRLPKDQPKDIQKKYFSTGIFLSSIGLCAAGLIFFIISRFFPERGIFSVYAHFIYLIILVTFFQSYFQQFTRSIDKMNVYVASGILLTGFTAVFAFVLIPRYGLRGFLWSQILATFCALVYTLLHGRLWKYVSIRSIDKVRYREMLKYSLPLVPNSVMAWLINGSNRFFLEKFHGLDAVGILASASKFPMLVSTVFNVFLISWQISVIEEYRNNKFHDFYNRIFSIVFLGLSVGAIIIILSSGLLTSILDEKFSESRQYIPILMIAPFLSSLAVFVGVNFTASKETKYLFATTAYGGLTSIAGNIILVPAFGIMGAAYSQILSFAVMLTSRIYLTRKMVEIKRKSFYFLSFIFLLLIVFLFSSDIFGKYPMIVFLILSILFLNKSGIIFFIHAIKIYLKTNQT